jgi:hypothetical protein
MRSRSQVKWLLLTLLAGCGGGDQFSKVPKPPPDYSYSKTYQMDTNSSEAHAVDVDILWVIDNSGSMGDYQRNVIANSATFVQQFTTSTALLWRMGLISTSYGEPPFMGFQPIVDWQSGNAVSVFNSAVAQLGTNGDFIERTFDPVLDTLKSFPSFLRRGAYLILIIVTDEEEQSSMSLKDFLSEITRTIGGVKDRFAAFGVYGPTTNLVNHKYADLVKQTRGQIYDITSPDFGVLLAELGQALVNRTTEVNPVIMLDELPDPKSIKVVYKGQVLRPGPPELGGQWTYEPGNNLIRIHDHSILDQAVLNVQVSFNRAQQP